MRERITTISIKLFDSAGIKGTSMDDIATELGISKRTLYEYFSSKDDLVRLYIERKIDASEIFTNTNGNLLDDLLHCYRLADNNHKHSFFEVRKYYKDVFTFVRQQIVSFSGTCKSKLAEAQTIGYVRNDITAEFVEGVVADYLFRLIFCKGCFQPLNRKQTTLSLLALARGISTQSGQNYIDNKLRPVDQ